MAESQARDAATSALPKSEGQRSSAWLTADSVAGWDRRRRIAGEVARLAVEVAQARHEAELATWELERLRARRAIRFSAAMRRIRRRRFVLAYRELKNVWRPPDPGQPPVPPAPSEPSEPVKQASFRGHEHYDHPHLRVGHIGATARYGTCAPHTGLEAGIWADQLRDGFDLIIVEPPSDGALPTWVPDMLAAARAAGIATVLVGEEDADPAPSREDQYDIRLHECLTASSVGDTLTTAPGIDPSTFNPVGWRAVPPDPVIAVVTATKPPPDILEALASFNPPVGIIRTPEVQIDRIPEGLVTLRTVEDPERLVRSLNRASVMLDHPDLHDGPTSASRLRAAAAAVGVCVVALEPSVPLADRPLVEPASLSDAPSLVHRLLTDLDARERHSIATRRAALKERDHAGVFRSLLDSLEIQGAPPPLVSVVVSTNRPGQLEHVLRTYSSQGYGRKELVLVLHGDGFPEALPRVCGDLPTTVLRIAETATLGECLNAGIRAARGDLIAKMDDDDHYGPHHLTDLVLAQRYSGADLVGKRVEFIHLAADEQTVRRQPRLAERYTRHVSGPTLLMTRDIARRVGFRHLPRRVDSTLCERITELGGQIYRTHSRDVILERHGAAHTWDLDTEATMRDAVEQRDGLAIAWSSSERMPGEAVASDQGS